MRAFHNYVFQISLVIFALLFGAGNLIFPLKLGLMGGSERTWAIAGFLVTGVLLPLIGLLAIIAFDGDYNKFFNRLGNGWGQLAIFLCMLTIGPVIVMPRIVNVAYEMMVPFMPAMPVWVFALIFLSLVFAVTYRPTRLLDIIGKVLSPLKVLTIFTIVIIGVVTGNPAKCTAVPVWDLFYKGVVYGYGTLDVLGTIFFGSIVVKLLRIDPDFDLSLRQRIKTAAYAGISASVLLSVVYVGMASLAAYHGQGLEQLNEGQLFSQVCQQVLGTFGAALVGFTVFIACFTTTVALTAVFTEYAHATLLLKRVGYEKVLATNLLLCAIPASLGLSAIINFSMPIIETLYPALITIAICNLAYKLWDFEWIKLPTAVTLVGVLTKSLYHVVNALSG